jgi:hypothetical protein
MIKCQRGRRRAMQHIGDVLRGIEFRYTVEHLRPEHVRALLRVARMRTRSDEGRPA